MKIAIDIHGVVTKHAEFFRELTKLFVAAGHEVHILTGSSIKEGTPLGDKTIREIKALNINYTHMFSIIDYHEEIGTEIEYWDSLNPWIDGDLWDKCKGEYCKINNIDIALDDTKGYAKHFCTPFVHFISIVPEKD